MTSTDSIRLWLVAGFPGPVVGEVPDEGDEPPSDPKPTKPSTSRFAFVVQVIEGESYPAEIPPPGKTSEQ